MATPAEPTPAQKLAQLRQRWERDPKSRVFLQLAEEYRRAGRLAEAVRILESGLANHPSYVAAQVVLGRCLIESGDMPRAAVVLERAVAADPTQIVASRLLVDAYLGMENAAKARERLEHYRLLNDRDADLEALERRVAALGGGTASIPGGGAEPASAYGTVSLASLSSGASSVTSVSSPTQVAPPAVATVPAPRTPRPSSRSSRPLGGRVEEPFGPIARPGDASRIVAAFAAGGIFPVEPTTRRPAASGGLGSAFDFAASAPVPASRHLSDAPPQPDLVPTPEPAREHAHTPAPPPTAPAIESEPVPATPEPDAYAFEFEPAPAAAPVEAPEAAIESEAWSATSDWEPESEESASLREPGLPSAEAALTSATLGALYLSQGHLEDAESSYQSVLAIRPDDADARAGLAEVRRRRQEAAAAFAAPPFSAPPFSEKSLDDEAAGSSVVGGLTQRKIDVLRDFMARMRRGSERHVS